jgi:hypothetical protein
MSGLKIQLHGRQITASLGLALCLGCGSSTLAGPTSSFGGTGNSGAAGAGGQTSAGGAPGGGAAGSGGAPVQGAGSGGVAAPAAGAGGGGAGAPSGGQPSGGQPSTEMPPDGVPQSYQLVYAQTFAEPGSLSDLVFANPTQWRHNAGGFLESTGSSYAPPHRSPFSVAIVKAVKLQSFVMDAEMQQTSPDGDAHRDMVLIWSFVDPSHFYYAHVSTAHDGVAHNILIVNDADRSAISTTFTPGYDWGRDVWKRLRVVRDADSGAMAVYDLDTPNDAILTASDTTFKEGYVGFGSFDNTGRVRNVKVWAAASTPGAPDFFAPAAAQ